MLTNSKRKGATAYIWFMAIKNYRWILYAITVTIVTTIGVQFYWNYKNYQTNKQRVSNDIQLSIDNALEEYYAELAKTDLLTIIKSDSSSITDSLVWKKIGLIMDPFKKKKPINPASITSIKIEKTKESSQDSLLVDEQSRLDKTLSSVSKKGTKKIKAFTQITKQNSGIHFEKGKTPSVQVLKGKKARDSINLLKNLNTILISFDRDTINYSQVDSLLKVQFEKMHITPKYALKHFKSDTLFYTLHPQVVSDDLLSINSKSTFLKPKERITILFQNPMKDALKLSFTGILISLILATAIIACLFYLLHIIKSQKQLAEIKNDLISNITHEFKTPISTISVALESLKNFNALADKVKTSNYLDISNTQLAKLNIMVEKLLETATLDSDHLELHKELINLGDLIRQLVERNRLQFPENEISISMTSEDILISADPFHIENALNNLMDNAFKYGGKTIKIALSQNDVKTVISIYDNGTSLKPSQKEQVFEKFYRVPQGDKHDVKGFGIGLFYTKKIIEKHGGTITLDLDKKGTTFKIILYND